jgi:hypothetical protein
MIVDEGDALFMWCPMFRIYDPKTNASGFNAMPAILGETVDMRVAACRASDCMMWRYANSDPDDSGGYCGLAGIPKF